MTRNCERCGKEIKNANSRFCSKYCVDNALEDLQTEMQNQDIDGFGGGY